jgi:hypothetical protein
MNKIVRLPSKAETDNAESRKAKAWFPQVGAWWKSQKGQLMFKLDILPDVVFLLQEPKPKQDQEQDYNADNF